MAATQIIPDQSNLTKAIRMFLQAELPPMTEIILAQGNRVPEPEGENFVVITPIRFVRLDTNLDESLDLKMTGTITVDVLDVTAASALSPGAIVVGSKIFGVDVEPGTTVVEFLTGTGKVGTYKVTPEQTIGTRTLSAGRKALTQAAEVTVQLDFHSQNTAAAGNMAQTISTLIRDEYGVSAFEAMGLGVVPFLADNPRQMPFINDQQQYEWRWILEARFQVNQQVSVPQEYADAVEVGLIEVDGRYPP